MPEPSRRGPYAKGVAKRQEILREALAAYAESGSGGPSLRSIAAKVGLSERGLLHYFGSKDELLVSILAERDAADRALFTAESPFEELAVVQTHSAQTPGLVRLFLELAVAAADRRHVAHAFFTARYERLYELLGGMIARSRRLAPQTEPPEADAVFAARMLIAASDGLQLQWLLDPTIDMSGDLARMARILLAAGTS